MVETKHYQFLVLLLLVFRCVSAVEYGIGFSLSLDYGSVSSYGPRSVNTGPVLMLIIAPPASTFRMALPSILPISKAVLPTNN